MVETKFDVLNIEYEDENYDYPDAMQITVDVPNDFKDKHYSFTEDLIRNEIEKITGSPYKVVDFTAFYSNTPYTLRGNYDAETFEAERRNLDGTLVFTGKDFSERGPRMFNWVNMPEEKRNLLYGYGNDILERVSWMKDKNGKIKGAKFKVWKKNAFEAETFEAREKKIGSIRIVKNPNFPSGTHLQGYIKTNRAELRKVFGNPNMGESGDGKSKGKEWNLVVGGKRVTIYDRREMGKKGTKYFNIGGDGKYSALLVAQALSIHRNERVHAKEITPKWLEDERRHEMVQSIDDYPDLTYERAKEYEDNRRRYRAETFNAEKSVHQLIVKYDGYSDTYVYENENQIKEALYEDFYGWEYLMEKGDEPEPYWGYAYIYDIEESNAGKWITQNGIKEYIPTIAEKMKANKELFFKKTQHMTIDEIIDYVGLRRYRTRGNRGGRLHYKKSILDLDKDFMVDGENGGIKQGHKKYGAETFEAKGDCKECYGTGGLYDSHMGINDECHFCGGTGFEY